MEIVIQQKSRAAQAETLRAAIRNMFDAQRQLREAFPKRLFTPDGRMIGDIGEAIAEITYQVTVDSTSRAHWDGKREDICEGCTEVQIRATQKSDTYMKEPPDDGRLLVFKIFSDGSWICCYNGDARGVWNSLEAKKANKSGEKFISLEALIELDRGVENCQRVPLRDAEAAITVSGDDDDMRTAAVGEDRRLAAKHSAARQREKARALKARAKALGIYDEVDEQAEKIAEEKFERGVPRIIACPQQEVHRSFGAKNAPQDDKILAES
jgi:hypothetical protein